MMGLNTKSTAIHIKFTKLLRTPDINNFSEKVHLLRFYHLRHNFMTSLVNFAATNIINNSVVANKKSLPKTDL